MSRLIIGVDPSLNATGIIAVVVDGGRISPVFARCIRATASDGNARLVWIREAIYDLVTKLANVDVAAVEMNVQAPRQGLQSSLAQREAVAVSIEALTAAGLRVERVTPSQGKAALAHHGGAKKGSMVRWAQLACPGIFTDLPHKYQQEAVADALGIALAGRAQAARREQMVLVKP